VDNPATFEEQAMSAYTVKTIDEMATIHDGLVKLAGAELGVESFGIQVFDFPPNFAHYPEHDHSTDGQEEVYVVLRGSADFEIDGERVPVQTGSIVRVESGCRRKLHPGPDGLRVVAMGGTPGSNYQRPRDFELAAAS
jgi:uncharacterized cupin superfamily protein